MHFKSTAMAKAMSLCATFALAFALSACDDSGTAANSDSNGGSGASAANPDADVQALQNGSWQPSKSCDFKVTDKAWKYSYWGKEDEKVTETYEYLDKVLRITQVSDIGESCNSYAREFDEGESPMADLYTSVRCVGNILIEVEEISLDMQSDEGIVMDVSRQEAFEGVLRQCQIELDIYEFPSDEI